MRLIRPQNPKFQQVPSLAGKAGQWLQDDVTQKCCAILVDQSLNGLNKQLPIRFKFHGLPGYGIREPDPASNQLQRLVLVVFLLVQQLGVIAVVQDRKAESTQMNS